MPGELKDSDGDVWTVRPCDECGGLYLREDVNVIPSAQPFAREICLPIEVLPVVIADAQRLLRERRT